MYKIMLCEMFYNMLEYAKVDSSAILALRSRSWKYKLLFMELIIIEIRCVF